MSIRSHKYTLRRVFFFLIPTTLVALYTITTFATASSQMWPGSCATGVSSNFDISDSGGEFEAIGCLFPSTFIEIRESATRISNAVAILIAGSSVAVNGGLNISWLNLTADAQTLAPIQLTIKDLVFGNDASIIFSGQFPLSSSLIVTNNSFFITKNNVVYSWLCAFVLMKTYSLALLSGSQLAISKNRIGGNVAGYGTTITPFYLLTLKSLTLSDSKFLLEENIVTDLTIVRQFYLFNFALANSQLSSKSIFSMSNNIMTNFTAGHSLSLTDWTSGNNPIDFDIRGGSAVKFCDNGIRNVSGSPAGPNTVRVVSLNGLTSTVTVATNSQFLREGNFIEDMKLMLTGEDIRVVHWYFTTKFFLTVSDNSILSMSNNYASNIQSRSATISVVYWTSYDSATIKASTNSSYAFDNNMLKEINTTSDCFVVNFQVIYDNKVFDLKDRSRFSISGNEVLNSWTGSAVAVWIYFGGYTTMFSGSGSSVYTFNKNKVSSVIARGDARCIFVYTFPSGSPNYIFTFTLSDSTYASKDGNVISHTNATGVAQVIFIRLTQSGTNYGTMGTILTSNSGYTNNNNAIVNTIALEVNVIEWMLFGEITVTASANSTFSMSDNAINNAVSYSTTAKTNVVWMYAKSYNIYLYITGMSHLNLSGNSIANSSIAAEGFCVLVKSEATTVGVIYFYAGNATTVDFSKNTVVNSTIGGAMVVVHLVSETSVTITLDWNSSWLASDISISGAIIKSVGGYVSAFYISAPKASFSLTMNTSALYIRNNFISRSTTVGTTPMAVVWWAASSTVISLHNGSQIHILNNHAIDSSSGQANILYWYSTTAVLTLVNSSFVIKDCVIENAISSVGISAVYILWSSGPSSFNAVAQSRFSITNVTTLTSTVPTTIFCVTMYFNGLRVNDSMFGIQEVSVINSTCPQQVAVLMSLTSVSTIFNSSLVFSNNVLQVSSDHAMALVALFTIDELRFISNSSLEIVGNSLIFGHKSSGSLISSLGFSGFLYLMGTKVSSERSGGGIIINSNTVASLGTTTTSGDVFLVRAAIAVSVGSHSLLSVSRNKVNLLGSSIAADMVSFSGDITLSGTAPLLSMAHNSVFVQSYINECPPRFFHLQNVVTSSAINSSVVMCNNDISITSGAYSESQVCPWLFISAQGIEKTHIDSNTVRSPAPLSISSSILVIPSVHDAVFSVSKNTFAFETAILRVIAIVESPTLNLGDGAILTIEENKVISPRVFPQMVLIANVITFIQGAASTFSACENFIFGGRVGRPAYHLLPSSLAEAAENCTISTTKGLQVLLTNSLNESRTATLHDNATLSSFADSTYSTTVNSTPSLSLQINRTVSVQPNETDSHALQKSESTLFDPTSSIRQNNVTPSIEYEHTLSADANTLSLPIEGTDSAGGINSSASPQAASSASLAPAASVSVDSHSTKTLSMEKPEAPPTSTTTELATSSDEDTSITSPSTASTTTFTASTTTNSAPSNTSEASSTETVHSSTGTTFTSFETNTDTSTSAPSSSLDSSTSMPTSTDLNGTEAATSSIISTSAEGPITTTTDGTSTIPSSEPPTLPTNTYSTPTTTTSPLPACPSLTLSSPTGTVPLEHVRLTGLTLSLTFANSSGLTWATNVTSNGIFIVATVLTDALRSRGFSLNCTVVPGLQFNDSAILQCKVPAIASYAIPDRLSHEVVEVWASPTAFSSSCSYSGGVYLTGSFIIEQRPSAQLAPEAGIILTAAMAAGPLLLAFIGDPTNVEVQALVAMFSAEKCATVDELRAAEIPRYITLSPFFGVGPKEVVLSHLGIILAVVVLQLLVATTIYALEKHANGTESSSITFATSLKKSYFPHLSHVVSGILFMAMSFCSLELLTEDSGNEDGRKVIGGVGLGFSVIILVCVLSLIPLRHAIGAVFVPSTVRSEDAKYGKVSRAIACYDYPSIRGWLWPRGTYTPSATFRAFYSTLYVVVPTRGIFSLYPLVMSLGLNVLLHVGPQENNNGVESSFKCTYRWTSVAIWLGLFMVFLATAMPHRAVATSHLASLSYLILVIVAAISASENSPEIGLNSSNLFDAKIGLAVALMVVSFVRTIHTLTFALWLDRKEEEHAEKKKTKYFDIDDMHDESLLSGVANPDESNDEMFIENPKFDRAQDVDLSDSSSSAKDNTVGKRDRQAVLLKRNEGNGQLSSDSGSITLSDSDSSRRKNKKSELRNFSELDTDDLFGIDDKADVVMTQPLPTASGKEVLAQDSLEEMREVSKDEETTDESSVSDRLGVEDEECFLF